MGCFFCGKVFAERDMNKFCLEKHGEKMVCLSCSDLVKESYQIVGDEDCMDVEYSYRQVPNGDIRKTRSLKELDKLCKITPIHELICNNKRYRTFFLMCKNLSRYPHFMKFIKKVFLALWKTQLSCCSLVFRCMWLILTTTASCLRMHCVRWI